MTLKNTPAVAVISCGYWGKNLVRNFYQLDGLAMVCDSIPEGRTVAAELAPQSPVVADFQRVLESDVGGWLLLPLPKRITRWLKLHF